MAAKAATPGQVSASGLDFGSRQQAQRGTRIGVSKFRPAYAGVTPERSFSSRQLAAMDTDKLLDAYANGTRISPFEVVGVPTPNVMSQYIEFVDEYTSGALGKSGAYNPKTGNVGGDITREGTALEAPTAPAPQSLIPTSTINPNRPRTLSAGFEIAVSQATGKLTVQFRDGTWYNYYEVTPQEWEDFKIAVSKGRFIAQNLDSHPRGFASGGNAAGRQALHKAARVSQRHLQARQGRQKMRQGKPVQVARQTRRK